MAREVHLRIRCCGARCRSWKVPPALLTILCCSLVPAVLFTSRLRLVGMSGPPGGRREDDEPFRKTSSRETSVNQGLTVCRVDRVVEFNKMANNYFEFTSDPGTSGRARKRRPFGSLPEGPPRKLHASGRDRPPVDEPSFGISALSLDCATFLCP